MKYFIPEWDDQVDAGYNFLEEKYSDSHLLSRRNDKYMWEIFEPEFVPFDGVLVSLMSIRGNGRKEREIQTAGGLHEYLRLPERFPILADCGAWGYLKEEGPPFDAVDVLKIYRNLDVQEAVTVDHLAIPRFKDEAKTIMLDTIQRMRVTYENGIKGFEAWRKKYRHDFQLLVSVQGLKLEDYQHMYGKYLEHGITSFAFGGLAKKSTKLVIKIIDELIRDIKHQKFKVERIHFFGLGRTNLFPKFKELEELEVRVSFDTASWLRRAWLGGESYFVDSNGIHKYTAIRIPFTDTNRSSFKGERKLGPDADFEGLKELETKCLRIMRSFENGKVTFEETFSSIRKFNDKLLEELEKSVKWKLSDPVKRSRKISDLRQFFWDLERQYKATLRDKPWTKCSCQICKDIGVEVMLFRGNDRNRRRGFHNLYTMYHNFLNNPQLWKRSDVISEEVGTISLKELANLEGKVLVVTGCTKTKLGYNSTVKAKAEEMYQGRLFKAVKAYSEIKKFPLVIISAKYGVVWPQDVIEGYEKVLQTNNEIEKVRSLVTKEMLKILPEFSRILVIAGQAYRRTLRDVWDDRFAYLKASGYADLCNKIEKVILNLSTPELRVFAT